MLGNKKTPLKSDKTQALRGHKRGVVGYSRKTALLEEAITQMNAGKYGRSSTALKELLALDPQNMEARRLFATLHLRLGSLIPARQAFDSLISEAFHRQDYWLAESLLREYLAAGPRCVPFLEKLGTLYQEKGDGLEAIAEYGKAIDILIEDPDPDNPHHASQLYAKIRELAPASPIAIRLASFFDAQTGELLARPTIDSEQSAAPLAPGMSEERQDTQGGPEPMDGILPSEIPVTAPNALAVDIPDSLESAISPINLDLTDQRPTLNGEIAPSDPPVEEREPTTSSASEVRNDALEEPLSYKLESTSSEAQVDDHSRQVILGDSYPIASSSESAECLETPREPDPAVSISAAQEQDSILVEAERKPEALHDEVSSPSTISLPTEPADALEVPSSSTQSVTSVSEPAVERSVVERAPDPAVSISAAQEQDKLLDEAEPEVLHDVSSPSVVSSPTEPAEMVEAPISAPQSIAHLSAVDAESLGTQLGSDSDAPSGIQEHNRLLAEAEPSCDVGSASLGSINVWESPSATPSVTDAGAAPSFKIEEISAAAFTEREPSKAEPVEPVDRPPSLNLPVETDSKQSVTEQPPSTYDPSIQEPVSVNEMAEPWKQPGFSWESVFNSAWKFESDHSASTPISKSTQTNVDEAITQAPTVLPHQDEMVENQAVEIPERQESALSGDQAASGSSIAPMPWDQVQESVIAILPSQPEQLVAESPMSIIGQSAVETDSDGVANVSESEAQHPSSSESSAAETGSFSIAELPQMPISPEPEISIADLGPHSSTTERVHESAESEPQLPVVSSPTMDEGFPSETSQPAIATPILQNRPVDDAVSPAEFSLRNADRVLSEEHEQVVVATQSTVQESTAEHPVAPVQPTGETVNGKSEEIPLSSPPLQPQQQWPTTAEVPHPSEEMAKGMVHEPFPSKKAPVEARSPVPEPVSEQEEWHKAGESIRFIEQSHPSHPSPVAHTPPTISERQDVNRSMSVAAAAVDVLFESSRNVRVTETPEPVAESKPRRKTSSALTRVRIAIASFVSSCFSTTRAIVATCVGLVMLSGVLIASGIGAIGLTWVIMEESSSPVFENLTTVPQRTLSDFKKNGYFLLLGIDAPVDHDPIQVGYERKPDVNDGNLARACFESGGKATDGSNASANVMRGWVRSSNPVGQFKSHQETIKGWGDRHQLALNRYGQWKKLPFEDWGYGQTVSPPCTAMVFAHQLHVADGFLQDADLGIDRLETDMEAWRIVLGQAKTLAVKMLALQAINDDVAVASGLLVRTDFDGKYLGRVTKFLRPLDQAELSMRWPMQSELVSASKTYERQLKAARAEEQPVYTMVASALPLPMQRRLNDYAEYYDASYKAASQGQYGSLPKWKNYIHFPASGLMDYMTNPIENIVGLEPLAPWDLYNGFVIDTEARLRLASLQAWLKRGPADGDLLTRIAKAGQNFYDPYTGLPMLVNMKKGVLYSVGHDGKDQDADPQSDVVVEIPVVHTSSAQAKSSTSSSKPR